jgi:mono/diheme cytochrome c family protein
MRTFAIGFGIVLVVGLLIFSLFRETGTPQGLTNPRNTALVAQGKAVYQQNCASCHGVNGEGQPRWQAELPTGGRPAPPHDASGHTWHHPDQLLFAIIQQGGQATSPPGYSNLMPAFGTELSDAEIWAVIAYLKSTWPAEIQAAQEEANQRNP